MARSVDEFYDGAEPTLPIGVLAADDDRLDVLDGDTRSTAAHDHA